jgi:glucan phosphoethanolaminetransferase (alkaline phosphatase superfamily)
MLANIFLGPPNPILMLYTTVFTLAFIFWVTQLVDCIRRTYPEPTTKIVWVLVIIFVGFIGAAIYYFAGKSGGKLIGQA